MPKMPKYFAPHVFTENPVRIDCQLPTGERISILLEGVSLGNQIQKDEEIRFKRRHHNAFTALQIPLSIILKRDGCSEQHYLRVSLTRTFHFPTDPIQDTWNTRLYLRRALFRHIVEEDGQLRILSKDNTTIVCLRGVPLIEVSHGHMKEILPATS